MARAHGDVGLDFNRLQFRWRAGADARRGFRAPPRRARYPHLFGHGAGARQSDDLGRSHVVADHLQLPCRSERGYGRAAGLGGAGSGTGHRYGRGARARGAFTACGHVDDRLSHVAGRSADLRPARLRLGSARCRQAPRQYSGAETLSRQPARLFARAWPVVEALPGSFLAQLMRRWAAGNIGERMFENDLPRRKIGVLTPLSVIDNGAYEFYRLVKDRIM